MIGFQLGFASLPLFSILFSLLNSSTSQNLKVKSIFGISNVYFLHITFFLQSNLDVGFTIFCFIKQYFRLIFHN